MHLLCKPVIDITIIIIVTVITIIILLLLTIITLILTVMMRWPRKVKCRMRSPLCRREEICKRCALLLRCNF